MTENQSIDQNQETAQTLSSEASPQERELLRRASQVLSPEELSRFQQGDTSLLQKVLSAPEPTVQEEEQATKRRRGRPRKSAQAVQASDQSMDVENTTPSDQSKDVAQSDAPQAVASKESAERSRTRKRREKANRNVQSSTSQSQQEVSPSAEQDQSSVQSQGEKDSSNQSEQERTAHTSSSSSHNAQKERNHAAGRAAVKPMYTREELESKKANDLRALIDRFQLTPSNRRSREVLITTILEYVNSLAEAQQAIDFKKQGDKKQHERSDAHSKGKSPRAKERSAAQATDNSSVGREGSAGQENDQKNDQKNNNRSKRFERKDYKDKYNNRRNRRDRGAERRYTREQLEGLKAQELRTIVDDLGLTPENRKSRTLLIECILEDDAKRHAMLPVQGILDVLPEGYGFLRTQGYLPSETDVYVNANMIRKCGLRRGDFVKGEIKQRQTSERYPALQVITEVDGMQVDQLRMRPSFTKLTPIYPNEHLKLEHGKDSITGRAIDLVAPIGKGQRGLIVSPPKAGKTTILKRIAESIAANNPEVILICLLVDERPEEVTDMERSISGEVVASTFDMPWEQHIAVSELVIERAKRLVESGRDVVILLDSITRLARAYNLAQPASGRILSGGVDSTALYPPKKFLGAARNIEGGGSLTILASALVDTGSKMDEVIFEEFKGTGNMELKLDRELADRRIFPAIDPVASGTRQEQLLIEGEQLPFIWSIRRLLANMNNTERAMDMLLKSLRQTGSNGEFLLRSARKAQQQNGNATL